MAQDAPPVLGGARRQDSVRAGLDALPEDCGWIVVHDGTRPFVAPALIEAGIEAAHPTGTAVAVVPAFDTVKRVSSDGGVLETLDRAELRMAQTPLALPSPTLPSTAPCPPREPTPAALGSLHSRNGRIGRISPQTRRTRRRK